MFVAQIMQDKLYVSVLLLFLNNYIYALPQIQSVIILFRGINLKMAYW